MSRRNPSASGVRRCGVVLGLAAMLVVGGCSGSDSGTSTSGSSSGTPTASATGTVNTNEIGGTGLKALSFHAEESPIGQGGAFTTTVSLGKAQVLFITDGNGAIRGLTLSITTANNSTLQVDATSTALGLLFLTPGILTLDPTEAQARVARLKALPSFVALVNFLQANLKTGSVQTLKAGPDFSNLLLACVEEWQASQPAPQQAASIASLALPTQPPSAVSSAIGSLVIPSGSSVEEEAGQVRVVVNVGPPDLRNIPVRIQNKGWRWVRLYRVSRGLNNEVVGVGQVPINENLGPIKAPSLGSIFTGTAYQPTETTDTISLPDNVEKVQYWIVGPGLGLNPLFNSTETDMPAQAGHEPHHPVSNQTDRRLGMRTMWDFTIQPVLGIIGLEFKSATADVEFVDQLITLGKCVAESGAFFTPDGTRRAKLSAATDLAVCIINVISDEEDVSIWGRLRNLSSKATAVGVLRAITSGLDLANFSLAVSSFLQVPHLALIEIVKKIGDVQFSQATYSVDKTAGRATISVNRVGAANGVLQVDYATSDETAKNGEDYTMATGTLTWQDKDAAPKTFVVPVRNNPANTASRSLTLTLKNPIGGRLGDPHTATLQIDAGCDDLEPNIYAFAYGENNWAIPFGGINWSIPSDGSNKLKKPVIQPGPVQVSSFAPNAVLGGLGYEASAAGEKGHALVQAYAAHYAGADAFLSYTESIMVTSPGKTGPGRAIINLRHATTQDPNCSISVCNDHLGRVWTHANVYNSNYNLDRTDSYSTPMFLDFTYGFPSPVSVSLSATATTHTFSPDSAHILAVARASVAYGEDDVTVLDDPNATVRFCRKASPPPTP